MFDADESELAVDTRRARAAGISGTGGGGGSRDLTFTDGVRELTDERAFVKLVFGVAYGVFDPDPEDDVCKLLCDDCGWTCELRPVPKVEVEGCWSSREDC